MSDHQLQFLATEFNRPGLKGMVDVVLDKDENGGPLAAVTHTREGKPQISHVVTQMRPKGALFDVYNVESFRGNEEKPFVADTCSTPLKVIGHICQLIRANP